MPNIITKLRTFKYNLIKEKNSDNYFDVFLKYASEEANFSAINYDYLEVGNVSDNYTFRIYNEKVNINKLVLTGSFKNVYIDDFNGAIKSVELKSTNSDAQISGILNGLEAFDVYFNNVSNGGSPINLQNVKKIIVHEGVSEFSLDEFEIDYYVNGYMELYLPSTLEKFECEKLSYGNKRYLILVCVNWMTEAICLHRLSYLKISLMELSYKGNRFIMTTLYDNGMSDILFPVIPSCPNRISD